MAARSTLVACAVIAGLAAGRTTAAADRMPRTSGPVDGVAPRSSADADPPGAAPPSKKAHVLAEKAAASPEEIATRKRWRRQLDRRIGQPPQAVINVYNTWTHETMAVPALAPPSGAGVPADRINRFFRCHFTNDPTAIDPRLFDALIAAARHFSASRVEIISGFRSPKYNLILRKKGREVARNSQHSLGHAIDFRLPGVGVQRLQAWARKLGLGGVGTYPKSGFIHIDVGRVRTWTGR